MEVMGYSQLMYGRTYDVMVFGAAGLVYLCVNGLLTLLMRLVERRALAFERRNRDRFISPAIARAFTPMRYLIIYVAF